MMTSKPKLVKVSGLPPLTFKARETAPLTDYTISGNTGEQIVYLNNFHAGTMSAYNLSGENITSTYWFPLEAGRSYTLGMDSGSYESGYRFLLRSFQTPYHSFTDSSTAKYCQPEDPAFKNADYTFTATNSGYGIFIVTGNDVTPEVGNGLGCFVKTAGAVGDLTKNVFNLTWAQTTINGVTITIHSDSTLRLIGTATGSGNTSNKTGFYMLLKSSSAETSAATIYQGKWRLNCEYTGTGGAAVGIGTVGVEVDCYIDNVLTKFRYSDGVYSKVVNNVTTILDEAIIDIQPNSGKTYTAFIWFEQGEIDGRLKIGLTPVLDETDADPYAWYKIPVTINGTTVNIYDRTPLSKTGDAADYIDYAEQKRYNADGTESTLPYGIPELTVSGGTNTLSVGTSVQPSEVSITGRIKPVVTTGGE